MLRKIWVVLRPQRKDTVERFADKKLLSILCAYLNLNITVHKPF